MSVRFGSSFTQSSQAFAQLRILSHYNPQNLVEISVRVLIANFTAGGTTKLFSKFQRYQNPSEAG